MTSQYFPINIPQYTPLTLLLSLFFFVFPTLMETKLVGLYKQDPHLPLSTPYLFPLHIGHPSVPSNPLIQSPSVTLLNVCSHYLYPPLTLLSPTTSHYFYIPQDTPLPLLTPPKCYTISNPYKYVYVFISSSNPVNPLAISISLRTPVYPF